MITSQRIFEIIRFLVAGIIGVCLYYSLLYFLTERLCLWYIFSAAFASLANFASNFIFQKFWTFKNKDRKNIRGQAGKYAVLCVSLFSLNLAFLYALTEYVHLWYIAAQIPTSAVLTATSYYFSQKIFKIQSP